jgi:hypothetical protein
VKPPSKTPNWAFGLVTTTLRDPATPDGVVAVIELGFDQATPVAEAPPIVTVAPLTKPVPAIVTAVFPVVGPEGGETLVTVGAATYVKPLASVPK